MPPSTCGRSWAPTLTMTLLGVAACTRSKGLLVVEAGWRRYRGGRTGISAAEGRFPDLPAAVAVGCYLASCTPFTCTDTSPRTFVWSLGTRLSVVRKGAPWRWVLPTYFFGRCVASWLPLVVRPMHLLTPRSGIFSRLGPSAPLSAKSSCARAREWLRMHLCLANVQTPRACRCVARVGCRPHEPRLTGFML